MTSTYSGKKGLSNDKKKLYSGYQSKLKQELSRLDLNGWKIRNNYLLVMQYQKGKVMPLGELRKHLEHDLIIISKALDSFFEHLDKICDQA